MEMWLRGQAGEMQYAGSFIQCWLQRLLYQDATEWVFVVVYTAFGKLVIITWVRFPARKISRTLR